jgi:hypothetical protein
VPIASGAKGRCSVLASPTGGNMSSGEQSGTSGLGHRPLGGTYSRGHLATSNAFRSAQAGTGLSDRAYTISGVTRDSTGAALASCTVELFDTRSDTVVQRAVSDGSGAYSFGVSGGGSYYVVAYRAGAPDLAGTTVNTLAGA